MVSGGKYAHKAHTAHVLLALLFPQGKEKGTKGPLTECGATYLES